jgi:hypothetical protein
MNHRKATHNDGLLAVPLTMYRVFLRIGQYNRRFEACEVVVLQVSKADKFVAVCSAKTTVVRKMHQCQCRFKEFYALREEDLFSQTALCEAELQCFDFKWLGNVTSTPFLSSSGNCCKMDFSS